MRYSGLVQNNGRDIFLQYGQKRSFLPGGMITAYEQDQNCLVFVEHGEVRVFCANSSGEEITLFFMDAGKIVSLQAAIGQKTALVNVDAVTDVDAYFLDSDTFIRQWLTRGYSIQDLLAHYVQRITLLSDYLCCAHFSTNEARLAYFLHSAHTATGKPITYSRDQIAAVTGMSRVSVDRILKSLEGSDIIRCGYKRIDVLDSTRLESCFGTVGYLIG